MSRFAQDNEGLVYNPEKKPYLVYGFDLGIGSCGWCVLDKANERVVALNSLIFPVPQEPKTKQSLAVSRGNDRRHRRTLRRKRAVRRHCLKLLDEFGFVEVPREPNGDISPKRGGQFLQRQKGEKEPIDLRAEGLNRLLTDREFARAIYSIAGHRGYIPHGEGKDGDDDAGKVLSAIGENAAKMEQEGWRTVGEMLFHLGTSRNHGDYSHCVKNESLCEEVRLLCAQQRQFGNGKASDEFCSRFIDECLTYLTKTGKQEARTYSHVKNCTYFPELKAAPSCSLSAEMLIAYERLTNARIERQDGTKEPLPRDVVKKAIDELFSVPCKGKVTYATLRKWIDLSGNDHFQGINSDEESKKEIFKPSAWKSFKGLPEDLRKLMRDNRELADAIAQALAYASSKETLEDLLAGVAETAVPSYILAPLESLSDEQAEAIAALPYSSKIYSGYGSQSLKVINLILEEFEQGQSNRSEIEDSLGLKDKRLDKGEKFDYLPPYKQFDKTCENPVVLRATANLRSLMNALIRRYGRPAEIHIELTRELKLNKTAKAAILKANNTREKQRKKHVELAASVLDCSPDEVPRKVLDKLILLEEQNDKDPYTGEDLGKYKREIILDPTFSQIDHIIPYSRSFEDSYANKVLVFAKSNQDKGQQSPYEWFGSDETRWSQFCADVSANKNFPPRKRRLLLCADVDAETEGFLNRNLNDTAYMTRQAALWIEENLRFDEQGDKVIRVIRTSGQVTGKLRYWWGLSKKDRQLDNRHHAVDAACIAACTQSLVKKTADIHSRKRNVDEDVYKEAIESAMPWPSFAQEVESLAAKALPARAPRRRVTGEVFEDMSYTFMGVNEKQQGVLGGGLNKGKTKVSGNYKVKDSAAKIIGDAAFLQLWWNSDNGKWIADPVYCVDIPEYLTGRYVPRIPKAHVPRNLWEPIPKALLNQRPIQLFFGDTVSIQGNIRIYCGYNINSMKWVLKYVDKDVEDTPCTILKLKKNEICKIDNTPLGFPGENLEEER